MHWIVLDILEAHIQCDNQTGIVFTVVVMHLSVHCRILYHCGCSFCQSVQLFFFYQNVLVIHQQVSWVKHFLNRNLNTFCIVLYKDSLQDLCHQSEWSTTKTASKAVQITTPLPGEQLLYPDCLDYRYLIQPWSPSVFSFSFFGPIKCLRTYMGFYVQKWKRVRYVFFTIWMKFVSVI